MWENNVPHSHKHFLYLKYYMHALDVLETVPKRRQIRLLLQFVVRVYTPSIAGIKFHERKWTSTPNVMHLCLQRADHFEILQIKISPVYVRLYTDSGCWSGGHIGMNIAQICARSRTHDVHTTWRKSFKSEKKDTPDVTRTSRLRLLLDRMINYLQSHPLECGTQDNWLPRQNVHLHLCRAGRSLDTTGLSSLERWWGLSNTDSGSKPHYRSDSGMCHK